MKYFINLFLFFGFFSVPSFGFIQRPSLEFYRIFLFNIILVCGIFFNFRYIREFELKKLTIIIGLFILFVTSSLIWSISKIDTLAYLNEVYFTFLFFLLLSFMDIKTDKVYKILMAGCILFIMLTIFGEIFLRYITVPEMNWDIRLQGVNGVHITKIYLSVIYCYLFSFFLVKRKIKYLLPLLITMVLIVLTLQRTVIVSMIISSLVIYFFYLKVVKRKYIRFVFISLFIIFITFLLFINYIPLKKRTFKYDISKTVNFIEGISSIDFKGRLELWSNYKITDSSLFGKGFNAVPFYNYTKFNIRNDLHNDYLKLLIEIGIMGFVIYIIMLINIFRVSVSLIRFKYDLTRIFAFTSIGILTFYFIFSAFDNAILHIHRSLLYALIFIVFSIKARRKFLIDNKNLVYPTSPHIKHINYLTK